VKHEPSIERIEPFADLDKGILSLRWFCLFADCIESLIGTSLRRCHGSSCGWALDVQGDVELRTRQCVLLLYLLLLVLLPMQLLVLGSV
jgi:hypothetical protein